MTLGLFNRFPVAFEVIQLVESLYFTRWHWREGCMNPHCLVTKADRQGGGLLYELIQRPSISGCMSSADMVREHRKVGAMSR